MRDFYADTDGPWVLWAYTLASQLPSGSPLRRSRYRDRRIEEALKHTEACDDPADLMLETESEVGCPMEVEASLANEVPPVVAHCPSEAESLVKRVSPGEAWVDAKKVQPGQVDD